MDPETQYVTAPYGTTTPDDGGDDTGGQDGKDNSYTAYYGTDWPDVRTAVLERDDHRCQVCGLTDDEHERRDDLFGDSLHVHHLTPARKHDSHDEANDLSNLVALCATCHRKAENGKVDPMNDDNTEAGR